MKPIVILLCLSAGMCLFGGIGRAADPPGEVSGTIVSVRGNIFVIRPRLRPKMTRVAVDENTQVFGAEQTDVSVLKPGMRVIAGGSYSAKAGFHPRWVEASDTPYGEMLQRFNGLMINPGGRAFGGGTLKSVTPFVFADDSGHTIHATLDKLFGVWHNVKMDRSNLLIGVRIDAQGPQASDGVIQAKTISADRNFAKAGTMFGVITAVRDNVLEVRPKYSTDTIQVAFAPNGVLKEEISIDESLIHVGGQVTFWGQPPTGSDATRPPKTLNALALLLGKERYPAAASGPEGGVFLTGKLLSLDPAVLALRGGQRVVVTIPGQMPIVRLRSADTSDLKPGAAVMLMLSRQPDGTFKTSTVVLNGSPWVGYGG